MTTEEKRRKKIRRACYRLLGVPHTIEFMKRSLACFIKSSYGRTWYGVAKLVCGVAKLACYGDTRLEHLHAASYTLDSWFDSPQGNLERLFAKL